MFSEASLEKFKPNLRGDLLRPNEEGYDDARKVYNGMIEKRPAIIVQCQDVADVMAAVHFGREAGMDIAVRGGGHNGPGLGTVDEGLVIDLRRMRGIRVDPSSGTVRVDGGCVWGDVDHATHPFGMATPNGFISTTGVGGLTLGGGLGYLSRRYGLTIDNLLGVDVVLADGRFVTADKSVHPDLFWAIRGGGGNFGIVTSFEYKLHPVSTVYGGPMIWPMERAPQVLRIWRDFIHQAPNEINGWFGLMTVPPAPPFPEPFHLKKMCAVVWCDTGAPDQAEQRLATIRKDFGAPAIDFAGPIPWPMLQSLFDVFYPPGLRWYWKSDFFGELSEDAMALLIRHGSELPTPMSTIHLYPIDGAVHLVDKHDTAFNFRDASFAEVILGIGSDPASDQQLIGWARNCWQALHPHSTGGGYINMIMDDGQDQVKAAYGDNYQRLAAVKKKYDPSNLFHVNQNIEPI